MSDTSTAALSAELDHLNARIQDGERRIAEAQAQGVDTTDWEAFWSELLERYESIYRRLYGPEDPEQRVLRELGENPDRAEPLTQTG